MYKIAREKDWMPEEKKQILLYNNFRNFKAIICRALHSLTAHCWKQLIYLYYEPSNDSTHVFHVLQ